MTSDKPTVLAYADRQSVVPGGEIQFKVSSANVETYRADVVRLLSPEVFPGPDSPDFREEVIETPISGEHAGTWQPIHTGSYVTIAPSAKLSALTDFTFAATVQPTLLGSPQTIFSSADPDSGLAIRLDGRGTLGLVVGTDRHVVAGDIRIEQDRWTRVAIGVDATAGVVHFSAVPVPSHRLEARKPARSTQTVDEGTRLGEGPLILAADLQSDGGGRPHPVSCFNGRIERPRLLGRALDPDQMEAFADAPESVGGADLIADWDLSLGIDSDRVSDVSGNGLDGVTMNLPTRAVGGSNWSGATTDWRVRPEEYGAIHFHEDDLFDAEWATSLMLSIPDDWPSGCFAGRFRADGAEFYVPFFVTPEDDASRADVAFLVSTATYAAYANMKLRVAMQWNELIHGRLTVLDDTDLLMLRFPELGLSTYDSHTDGSTVVYSSMRRPVTNFRPKGRIYKFCQDLLIVSWLEHEATGFDVITDEDLDRQGVDLLRPYRVVVTSSHPEYVSTRMMDAVEEFVEDGGRLMYIGGNGFHHRIAYHPSEAGVVEVRRPDAPRLWVADPSQGSHTFTEELAGTWTGLGRAGQYLSGVAFVTQGFDTGSYYRRTEAGEDARARFIFDGVEDELVGDFGMLQGGAAGYEIDRASHALGTPRHALVVASSENHSNLFDIMVISLEDQLPNMDPDSPDRIRADMVFFETPGGGAVFSVGSIAWSGSLSHNRYDNNVARVSSNVLRRFLEPEPFEVPGAR